MITPKYLSLGLRFGLLKPADVQTWVNDEIKKYERPSDQLIELAFMDNADVKTIFAALNRMSDSSETYDVVRELVGNIKPDQLKSIGFCRQLTEELYNIWAEADYKAPEDLGEIGFLHVGYALAAQGAYGTLEEWHSEFKEFVSSLSRNE